MALQKTVYIQPTTGGQLEIRLAPDASVNNLKRAVANRLKVPKDKIVLLHKNRQLTEGSLEDNYVMEGAKLTLLPSVETGLMTQRPEQCVMQALETLNDSQVDNFLAGRAPLNLTMRLGDHMMFIQLQLSTVVPSNNNSICESSSHSSTTVSATTSPSLPTPPTTPTSPTSPTSPLCFPVSSAAQSSIPPSPPPSPKMSELPSEASSSGSYRPSLNSQALAEASRNLTHTLRQLSSAALTKKMNESCDGRCCRARKQGGAVIESMYHHGRGVYSGTFSGTLSPSLQDKDGRPRRDISTVIHILNDLLGASSHCRPSAQCLCSSINIPETAVNKTVNSLDIKVNSEEQQQDENRVLREKVEQIQSMLEEKRLKRKARRNVRSSPYASGCRILNSRPSSNDESKDFGESTTSCSIHGSSAINSDCNDQKMTDYSSETAVA